jgi:hypothetical protein
MKAWSGAVGGTLAAAAENPSLAPKIISTFTREGPRIFKEAFKKGATSGLASAEKVGAAPNALTRIYGAVDAAARHAMESAGISADDAARYTLSGKPTSVAGTKLLGALSDSFLVRYFAVLFPRVGVQQVERTLERTPLLGMLKGVQTGNNPLLKQVYGAIAATAGASQADTIDPTLLPFISAGLGPYGALFSVGAAGMKAHSAGKGLLDTVQAGINEAGRNSPLPQYGADEMLSVEGKVAGLVPAVVRDIAQMRDPQERDTKGDFGRAKAKIPGLRETLPIRPKPVNIAGQSVEGERSPLKRFFTTAQRESEPMKGVPDPVVQELRRLDISINPPAYERKVKIGNREIEVPADAATRAQGERRALLIPRIEKLLASPGYQAADDAGKKRRLEHTIRIAQEVGSRKAKANVTRVLRASGLRR